MKEWIVSKVNKAEVNQIATECGLPTFLAMLLSIRGINNREDIQEFLSEDGVIASPFEIKDMDKAASRIISAIDNFEKICIYGDYDADGVTATALLYSYLETVGANVMYYIPDREKEGYGMNMSAIDFLSEQGVNLIITVDNGVNAHNEINYAKSLGMDTVVTDHHTPSDTLPNAVAVVNLHRKDCNSKFKELCGVGTAFKLVMALEGADCDVGSLLDNYSELVAIGTVGDIVTLRSENRTFVKSGLRNLCQTERVGVLSILRETGLINKQINAGNISFVIVPRINAVGRLGSSTRSVELLLTDDEYFAEDTSKTLSEDNARRQNIEKQILQEINTKIINNPSLLNDRVVVIDGDDWHCGVIGIVAAKVKELCGKPCIIISRSGEVAKGSGRSIEGFSLCDAMFACNDLLMHGGGHPMAVGLSIDKANIEEFKYRINQYAQNIADFPNPRLNIDCKLNPSMLNLSYAEQIKYLEPFGAGNASPVFGLYGMTLSAISELSGGKHLRLVLSRDNSKVSALLFSTERKNLPYNIGDKVDIAVSLDINEFNGNRSLSIFIKDIKFSDIDNKAILDDKLLFETFAVGGNLTAEQLHKLCVKREDFAVVYRYLKSNKFEFSTDILYYRLDGKITYAKLMVILTAMQELSLISVESDLYKSKIEVLPANQKVDLFSAPIIRRVMEGVNSVAIN